MSKWHKLDIKTVLKKLGSDRSWGLNYDEVIHRLKTDGPNKLREQPQKPPWRILWEQLMEPLVLLLVAAAILSALLGDYKEAIVILIIVILNALLGFSQEYQAEKAMAALKTLAIPQVKVRREGHWGEICVSELVVGDIVALEDGTIVPADLRLVEVANLRIQESILTGEAEAVHKTVDPLTDKKIPLGDRLNMAYMGTLVIYGRGCGVVVATGMKTQLGKIAKLLQKVTTELTPLQQRLQRLGQQLLIASVILVAIIFGLGLMEGEGLKVMFLTAVSLAVAAVPEGLPAVVTIALALGSQRMLKRGALIRKLPAVETLGSVTVVCSDKTGTLTENRMTVNVLDVVGRRLNLTSQFVRDGHDLDLRQQQPSLLEQQPQLVWLLLGSTLCNDASLEADREDPQLFHVVGEPTEGALITAAASLGLKKADLDPMFPRVAEIPFDAQRRRMTTLHQVPSDRHGWPELLQQPWKWHHKLGGMPYIAFTKGAVDSLLEICSDVWVNNHTEPLTETWQSWIQDSNDQLAAQGSRVLGLAFQSHLSPYTDHGTIIEHDLIFVGLMGMSDPIRPEVTEAVQTCMTAGILPVMITGDHPLTAKHIAKELGMMVNGGILTGQDLSRLKSQELSEKVLQTSVYARVSPKQKLQIVQAWQQQGQIVAMTGDGVNDAPALKKADIGIAMGVSGTDVAKEAADMALLDDNFATIVAAVKEGRIIYDNVRKFIFYMFSSNSGEIWVMLVAFFLGMPLPLLPLQILWINLMTDGLPALALGVEPAEKHIMQRSPYSPSENIFSRGLGWRIIWVGLLMGVVSLGTGYYYWQQQNPGWQTMIFTIVTLSQMGNALAIRSERYAFWKIGLFSNPFLILAVILTVLLQIGIIYVPFWQTLFQTTALSVNDLLLCLLLSTAVFWAVEAEKWWLRCQHLPKTQ
ncbi:MAG: cation-translocating P-type ATPase [Crocosphaera sp.]